MEGEDGDGFAVLVVLEDARVSRSEDAGLRVADEEGRAARAHAPFALDVVLAGRGLVVVHGAAEFVHEARRRVLAPADANLVRGTGARAAGEPVDEEIVPRSPDVDEGRLGSTRVIFSLTPSFSDLVSR